MEGVRGWGDCWQSFNIENHCESGTKLRREGALVQQGGGLF